MLLMILGLKLSAKLTKKSIMWPLVGKLAEVAKTLKKLFVFQGFLVPRPSNFEAKLTKKLPQTNQKSRKNVVSILMQILIDLEANLGRFWEGFGGQVGRKLAPNGNKPDPTTNQKYDRF